MLTYS
jgi:hypothetical protein